MAPLAGAVPLLAQLDPPPTGIAVTSEPNAPPLPNDPSTRLPIFFPPLPPIVGTVIRGHHVVDLRYVAPGELAPFVNEQAAVLAHLETTARG